jgi:RHS repeat-associated protein
VGTATLAINNQTLPSVNQLTNRFNLGQGFEYDKSGNIIKDSSNGQVRNFIFNGDNKQVHVKNAANENIGTYYYDGNGSRVKKVTQSETTIFAYDGGGKLVAEYSTQQNSNPTISYTATDTLGSPRVITDKNGNVISRRDFMPFGEELNANTATNRLETAKYNYGEDNVRKRFTGYEKDQETGLDFAEARYYNNKHGRFTAVDPLLASGKAPIPQSFNRYTYCLNNPIILTDSSGLQAGFWAFRDVRDKATGKVVGTDIDHMKSEAEFTESNRMIGSTGLEKKSSYSYDPWQKWTKGDFVLQENRSAYKLNEDGTTGKVFSTENFSNDEWSQTVGAWYDGTLDEASLGRIRSAHFDGTKETNGLINLGYALGFSKSQSMNAINNPIGAAMLPELQFANSSRLAGISARNSTVNAMAESMVSGVKGNQKFALGVDFSSGRVFSATSGGAYNAPLSLRARIGLTFANLTGGTRRNYSLTNCAEFRVCNNAANAGVRNWNFTFTTVNRFGVNAPRCFNCQITTPVFGASANGNQPRF